MATAPKRLDRPLAWVTQTYEAGGVTEVEIIREGMSRQEIVAAFPPSTRFGSELDFCRKDLVKAVIYEEYLEVVEHGQVRDKDNIRGFWYSHLMHTLLTVMGESGGDDNINSIGSTINGAWKDLVEGGFVTYSAMNIHSEKDDYYNVSVAKDSPYPRVIVMVEKASLYDALHDLADIYEISFCCTGGQSSRAAAMQYVSELERLGVDLTEEFTVFSFCDFDPEGWIIPESFVSHLRLKISGPIQLVRVGLTRQQLGDSTIQYQAVPYSLDAKSEKDRRAKRTKWDNFAAASGGLLIPDPDGSGDLIPGRVELNIYTWEQIRERIIDGLCAHLDGFGYQVRALRRAIELGYDTAGQTMGDEIRNEAENVFEPYRSALAEAQRNLYRAKAERTREEDGRITELYEEMRQLEKDKLAKTSDLDEVTGRLSALDDRLTDMTEMAITDVWWAVDCDKSASDLIRSIEQGKGWREFAAELGINGGLTRQDLAASGRRKHGPVEWKPDRTDQEDIDDWVYEELDPSWPDVVGPTQTPEAMVQEALGGTG